VRDRPRLRANALISLALRSGTLRRRRASAVNATLAGGVGRLNEDLSHGSLHATIPVYYRPIRDLVLSPAFHRPFVFTFTFSNHSFSRRGSNYSRCASLFVRLIGTNDRRSCVVRGIHYRLSSVLFWRQKLTRLLVVVFGVITL